MALTAIAGGGDPFIAVFGIIDEFIGLVAGALGFVQHRPIPPSGKKNTQVRIYVGTDAGDDDLMGGVSSCPLVVVSQTLAAHHPVL